MPLIRQQKAAADALGVSARTLRDWSDEPGFPDCSAGYDIAAINVWRQQNERKGSALSDTGKKLKLALAGEKLKQAQLQTRRDQLNLEKQEGSLIPRKGVEQSMAVILSGLGDWCDQLPDLIAGIVPKKYQAAIRARLKQELDERRRQMSDDLKSVG